MKRCTSTAKLLGQTVRCKLPYDHDTLALGDMDQPLNKHEYWETRKVRGKPLFHNVTVEWFNDRDYKYGELQGEVRGGPYKGIK